MSDTKHAFASYVREDYDTVARLADALSSSGVRVWLDRNEIQPGTRWKSVIKRAIHDGSYFLACFSRHYLARTITYMNEELTLAIELLRQRPVDHPWFVPILLDDCEVPEREIGAGETLRDIQYVALFEDWDRGIGRILNVIQPNVPGLSSGPTSPEAPTVETVLFLGSDPFDKPRLRLDSEVREIQGALLSSGLRDRIRFEIRLAVTPTDIARSISMSQPTIVHFSGHGSSGFLGLQDERGRSIMLHAKTFLDIVLPFYNRIRCIILNAAYSQSLARELSARIEFAIGMPPNLSDSAAVAFAAGFYQAIGNGKTIPESFNIGCSRIRLTRPDVHTMPILFSRSGGAS